MNRPSPDNMDLDIGHRERERQRHPTDRLLTTMKNHAIDLYHYTLFVFSSLILSLTLRHTCSFAHLLWSAVAFIYFFFCCAFLLCRMDRRFHYSTWNSGNDDPCNIAIYMCVETESCFPLGVLGVCETTTIAIAAYE